MKKFIIIAIICCLVIAVISVALFMYYSTDCINEQLTKITSIVFQAILSGSITFIGLFFTVLSQEVHKKEQQKDEVKPCFVINPIESAGPKRLVSELQLSGDVVLCSEAKELRALHCELVNTKENYGLNVSIQCPYETSFYLGSVKKQNHTLKLLLDGVQESYLWLFFEDVYGVKYKQKIVYKYEERYNRYRFTSVQPKRRK